MGSGSFKNVNSKLLVYQITGLMVRAFANGPGERGSIPGRDIPKTHKTGS